MNKKLWLMMGLVFLLVISFVVNSGLSGCEGQSSDPNSAWDRQVYQAGQAEAGSLALLSIDGVISSSDSSLSDETTYNHEAFLAELEDAFADPDIKGVLIKINSPGGGVYESSEVYQKILALKQRYDKPYVVYMEQLAASGGYYVSLPADRIYANQNTMTGSIGVIMSTINYGQLAEKLGIEEVVIKSGANKDMLSPMREMTPEEREILNSIMLESYNDFLDAFMQGRGLSQEIALPLADGRIYTARQAQAASIIDEIGSLEQALQGLAELADLQDPQVLEYRNKPLSPFEKIMGLAVQAIRPDLSSLAGAIDLGMESVNRREYMSDSPLPQLMYMTNWND
jgi:protease-4